METATFMCEMGFDSVCSAIATKGRLFELWMVKFWVEIGLGEDVDVDGVCSVKIGVVKKCSTSQSFIV